jgi:hypothetical protein
VFRSSEHLRFLGLPVGDAHSLPESYKRFPDGGQYRIEIPSVEGVECIKVTACRCCVLLSPTDRILSITSLTVLLMVAVVRRRSLQRARSWMCACTV